MFCNSYIKEGNNKITAKNKKIILFFILLLTIFLYSCNNASKNFYYSGHLPPVRLITINEKGNEYKIEAISGHVIVIFKPSISHTQAVQLIKINKGKIIGQLTDINYYLVFTGKGNESDFINKIINNNDVKFAYLNSVEYPRKIDPQTYVIDNFYISHGDNVKYALQECGLTTRINSYNVGIKSDEDGKMSWGEIASDLTSILKFPTKDTPLIINMSFGPGFIDNNIDYWTDKGITDEIKNNYIKQYKESLKHIIALTSNYKDKDFVIVKAAGNEGLKQLDTEILNDFGKELTNDEINILNEHFILVGAVDKRNSIYSNTVTRGNYSFLYTSVDISDLKNSSGNLYGTSFAAPRVSCFVSTAVNENEITATEVLKAIKDITRRNPDIALTQEIIEKEVKIIGGSNKKNTKPVSKITNNKTKNINTDNTEISKTMKNAKDAKNLAGTIWQCQSKDTLTLGINRFIEFKNKGEVEINDVYSINLYTGYPLKEPYIKTYNGTYYYETKPLKRWVVKYNTDTKENKAEIILQGNVLILGWLGTNLTEYYKRVQ